MSDSDKKDVSQDMQEQVNLEIVWRDPEELVPSEYNPRELTKKQYQDLKASIRRYGLVDPIIVNKHPDREDVIIGGHQRHTLAMEMGFDMVPTVELSLDVDAERELNIRLNKNTGQWDWETMANNFDMDELMYYGFEEGELEFPDDDDGDDDYEPGKYQFSEELEAASNYVVLKFDKKIDFLQIQSLLGLETVYSKRSNGKAWSRGIGRVVDGVDAIADILEYGDEFEPQDGQQDNE